MTESNEELHARIGEVAETMNLIAQTLTRIQGSIANPLRVIELFMLLSQLLEEASGRTDFALERFVKIMADEMDRQLKASK